MLLRFAMIFVIAGVALSCSRTRVTQETAPPPSSPGSTPTPTIPDGGRQHAQGQSKPEKDLTRKLSETMAKIRQGKTVTYRTEAAQHLATLTHGADPNEVDDSTLTEMVSLLDTPEDSVRAWVAAALGLLGPRAKMAIPRLLKLLAEVDCLQGDLTSAASIRPALERMGATPPPPPRCN